MEVVAQMSGSGQAIKVVVSLVGPQDVAVVAHRPGTDGAAISVRIGGSLIYIHDAETANSFHRAWQSGARQARSLPVRSDPTRVMPVAGVAEPAVMMEAAESPPAGARLDQAPGRRTSLWVTLGRIGFDVRDHAALRSAMAAFRRADNLAATAFPPTPEERACDQAARTAARLFATPNRVAAKPVTVSSRPTAPARALPAARTAIGRAV
ncbi:hypothetical protein [Pseudonocardia abyssalis]|uniref:Uncharacterized protein n=1 Tax=Pseudonocardia abyssalis TaxID=2792008 RepID=A0ABS6UM05_9PSEU|nr:hypothetical protein [Pseudonocardia abyssalis]MBW0119161.1 hypothetical protein [Pseudonocardia abyssalis]MBW0133285.1 hypothetical protein [Pseudonocardia abyssalis]